MEKYGFVYIWYDRKQKRHYIGSHWGNDDDGYICSSKKMRDNHRNRPETFCRRILKRIYTNRIDLLAEEQRWLDMIPREKFGKKYYNVSSSVKKGTWWVNEHTKKVVGKKISKHHKEDPNFGKWNVGIERTEEQRDKYRVAAKNQWQVMSEEKKLKCKSNLVTDGSNCRGKKTGRVPKSAFKKGNIPWHKGTKGVKLKTKGSTGMKFAYKPRPSMLGNQNARKAV